MSYQQRITPEEAIRQWKHTTAVPGAHGLKIARALLRYRPEDAWFVYTALFNAGRVQGIREERARKKGTAGDL